MIDSYMATVVLLSFLFIFGIILPILDKAPVIKDFISFRWTIVVIYSALCIGVIIDFDHLDTSVRFAVVIGGIVLAALFLIVRSLEKAAVNRWKFPRMRGKVQKGNIQAELSVNPKIEQTPSQDEISKVVLNKSDDVSFEESLNKAMSGVNKDSQFKK